MPSKKRQQDQWYIWQPIENSDVTIGNPSDEESTSQVNQPHRGGTQAVPRHVEYQEIHEYARQHRMEQHRPPEPSEGGQNGQKRTRQIPGGDLKIPKEGRTAISIGIPERESIRLQLTRPELGPGIELLKDVSMGNRNVSEWNGPE